MNFVNWFGVYDLNDWEKNLLFDNFVGSIDWTCFIQYLSLSTYNDK